MSRSLALSRLLALVLVPVAMLTAACADDPVAAPLPDEARIDTTTFAPALNIDLSAFTVTASGLYYRDLKVGTGDSTAKTGNSVLVHYKGWLPNGTLFDQSSPDQAPFGFTIGAGSVIRAWDEGIIGMRVGGQRILIVPPSLGYGYPGSPPRIPSNSVLVFRVDVHSITTPKPTTGT
jgi:FKBP-type peptidyl-prolyl cis-trans isomerase FkpA